ncbi:MAG: hypothetical protein U1F43_20215 [Myxococcota bacterium]
MRWRSSVGVALLELARRERFAIVEDDYDHEFHYDGRPTVPLASADLAGSVVYVGSSKVLVSPRCAWASWWRRGRSSA